VTLEGQSGSLFDHSQCGVSNYRCFRPSELKTGQNQHYIKTRYVFLTNWHFQGLAEDQLMEILTRQHALQRRYDRLLRMIRKKQARNLGFHTGLQIYGLNLRVIIKYREIIRCLLPCRNGDHHKSIYEGEKRRPEAAHVH